MSTLTLRQTKGSPLTNQEMDDNLTNLNNDKVEKLNGATAGYLPTLAADGGFQGQIDPAAKADKVSGATNGNLAGLDASGNLTDSGVGADDALAYTIALGG